MLMNGNTLSASFSTGSSFCIFSGCCVWSASMALFWFVINNSPTESWVLKLEINQITIVQFTILMLPVIILILNVLQGIFQTFI
jgi:hypothetical protein